jgi:NRPS condensation-like uncharacterized protein
MDDIIKETTCAGNYAQVVFLLNSRVEEELIRSKLVRFMKEFPVLQGRLSRDFNLAPYWKFPKRQNENRLNFNVYSLENTPSEKKVIAILEECINMRFKRDSDHLAFHLVHAGNRQCYLVVTFDHRLFDARGAEMFISLFQQRVVNNGDSRISGDVYLKTSPELTRWKEKCDAGKNVNRRIVALSEIPIRSLPLPNSETKKRFRFSLICFDQQESKRIHDKAYNEAGYLMEMPYLLAIALRTIHELFEKRGISAPSYMVPVSVDMRRDEDISRELFANFTSMFFFQIHTDTLIDQKTLIKEIKRQMYEQVKSRFTEDLVLASSLIRIAPITILNKIFRRPFDGKIASFCFAYVGKNSYEFNEFMGAEIANIFHMPCVPVPPGVGIFFNSFNGRLNAIITWLDGLLSDEEVAILEKGIKANCENEKSGVPAET